MFQRVIADIASFGFGGVVGYFAMFFLVRIKKFTSKEFASLIGVILGGTVLGFLSKLSNFQQEVLAIYIIGVFLGVVSGIFMYRANFQKWPIIQTFLQSIGVLTKKNP